MQKQHCLHCLKSNVPLFEEWSRSDRVFCGKPCQQEFRQQFIDASVLLAFFRQGRESGKLSPLQFWEYVFTIYKNSVDDIISDFADNVNLSRDQEESQEGDARHLLRWLHSTGATGLIWRHWRRSTLKFFRDMFESICRLGKVNLADMFLNDLDFYKSRRMITDAAVEAAIAYNRLDVLIVIAQHHKFTAYEWAWAIYFHDEHIIELIASYTTVEDRNSDHWMEAVQVLIEYPLRSASRYHDNNVLKVLLRREFTENQLEIDPLSLALRGALQYQNYLGAEILLADPRLDLHDEHGDSAFNYVAQTDREDLLHKMVERLSVMDDDLFTTAAAISAGFGNMKMFQAFATLISTGNTTYIIRALRNASRSGHAEMVRYLLQPGRADPAANDSEALRIACMESKKNVNKYRITWSAGINPNGHAEVVSILLSDGRADPSARENFCIRAACALGHLDIVKLLLNDPRVDPSERNNWCINVASSDPVYRGDHNIVTGDALFMAEVTQFWEYRRDDTILNFSTNSNAYAEIVSLLLRDPRVDPSGALRHTLNIIIANMLVNDPRVVDTVNATLLLDFVQDNQTLFTPESFLLEGFVWRISDMIEFLLTISAVRNSLTYEQMDYLEDFFKRAKFWRAHEKIQLVRRERRRQYSKDDEGEQTRKLMKNKI